MPTKLSQAELLKYRSTIYGVAAHVGHVPKMHLGDHTRNFALLVHAPYFFSRLYQHLQRVLQYLQAFHVQEKRISASAVNLAAYRDKLSNEVMYMQAMTASQIYLASCRA